MDSNLGCDDLWVWDPAFTHTHTHTHTCARTHAHKPPVAIHPSLLHHPANVTVCQLCMLKVNATSKPNCSLQYNLIINLLHCNQSNILLMPSLLFITAYLMKRNKWPLHHNTVLSYTILSVEHSEL